MLGKLWKHELRATAAPMLLLNAGVLTVSILTRLCMLLAEVWDFFAILSGLTIVLYGIGVAAAYIFQYVLILRRFYSHIYGAEGYITLTLPVKRWQIIFSKLTVAMVWMLLGAVTMCASVMILLSFTEFYYQLAYFFSELSELASYLVHYLNMPIPLLAVELTLACVISLAGGILALYAAISIGQLFKKHRLLGSVGGFMMIYAGNQLIMSGYTTVAGLTLNGMGSSFNLYRQTLDRLSAFQLQVLAIVYLVICALLMMLYWLITHTIMKRAVNLQ